MKKEIDVQFLARINKAVLAYYAEATPFKTEVNFMSWIETLTPVLQKHFKETGFEREKNSIPFLRYVLELNDIGMDDFLRRHLSDSDFLAWKNPDACLIVPNEMNLLK